MKKKFKVGLITTVSPDKTWSQDILDKIAAKHSVVKEMIEKMGFEVVDRGTLHREYHDMLNVGKSLRADGINALVLFVGNWTYSNCAAAAALEADVPTLVLPDAEPGTAGLVGGSIVRGGLAEMGVKNKIIYGPFKEQEVLDRIKSTLSVMCVSTGLRGQIMGVGGGRSMGMLTAVCDPNFVRKKFGLEIDSFEQMEIIDRAEKVDGSTVETFYKWIELNFGGIVAEKIAVDKQIRLYLALKEFIEEKKYDFVAVKCLPELPAIYSTFCIAHSLLGDVEDAFGLKDRMIFSCEGDINAALTMQLMLMLTGGPVMFTDLTQYDFKSDVLTTCNCGSQPTDFAKSKKDVIWEREGVHEFNWKYGGTCPQHVTKAGRVTLARLSRDNGKYEMLIAPAEAVEFPREKLKETVWERPHAYFKLLCNKNIFFESVKSNHIHMAYGQWEKQLGELCEMMDIKPVVLE